MGTLSTNLVAVAELVALKGNNLQQHLIFHTLPNTQFGRSVTILLNISSFSLYFMYRYTRYRFVSGLYSQELSKVS